MQYSIYNVHYTMCTIQYVYCTLHKSPGDNATRGCNATLVLVYVVIVELPVSYTSILVFILWCKKLFIAVFVVLLWKL